MNGALAVAVSGKSPEAFRTISEVACELDVPQHVLRFWESRFNQIRPLKRAGGRRFYRPEDVDLLRGVRLLLYHEGYTIRGVQKVLRERGYRHVAELGRFDNPAHDGERFVSHAEEAEDDSMEALAALARVHAENADMLVEPEQRLTDEKREALRVLLLELLELKSRFRAARDATHL